MMKELLLLRHGKSDWRKWVDDFERPLKKRGKRGAQLIGRWLLDNQRVPELVLSSPAARAKTTAEHCCKVTGVDDASIWFDDQLYLADQDCLFRVLRTLPEKYQRVMMVGHNPGLEELLSALVTPAPKIPADGKLLPTATLACIQLPEAWSRVETGCGTLEQLVRARSLETVWQVV